MDITGLTETVMGEIRETVRSRTVIGTPIRSGDAVMVPVTRIAFGFGAFGGDENRKRRGAVGIGAGVTVEPVGFLVIGKGKPRLLPIRSRAAAVAGLFAIVPPAIRMIAKAVRSRRSKRREQAGECPGIPMKRGLESRRGGT